MSITKNAVNPFNPPTDTSIMTAKASKIMTLKDKKMKSLSYNRMIEAPLLSSRLEKSYPLQSKNAVIQSPRVTIDMTNQ